MKKQLSEKQIVKAFLFTVKEYKRFAEYFGSKNKHTLLDGFTEEDYIAVQTKLMILRKYSYNRDVVYIPKVIEAGRTMFQDLQNDLNELQIKYDDIEKNQLQSILGDGSKLSLFEMQECVVYGLYLHADEDKIEKILNADDVLTFSVIRKYVEDIEKVIFQLYQLLDGVMDEKYEKKISDKAAVIFVGDQESSKQEITNSPYWSNMYGKDSTIEEFMEICANNSEEDNLILLISYMFFNEAKEDDYCIDTLEKLVFPPTRHQWGDFSALHEFCKENSTSIGFSSAVKYNEKRDMAYVHLYPNVEGVFIFDQPHVITDVTVINLVYDNDDYGWRVFGVGPRMDNYKENIGICEWIKRTLGKKR